MAKNKNTAGKVREIIVRMYRAGTGDFFILQFTGGNAGKFNMMIDCGCINGGREGFEPLVENLKAFTGGVIDLLVVTHQHADHINGFEKCAAQFDEFIFKKVWFAWTEDDKDTVANKYRAEYSELTRALTFASNELNNLVEDGYYEALFAKDRDGDSMREGREHFIQSLVAINDLKPVPTLGVAGQPLPTMVELFKSYKVIKSDTEVEFLEPGDVKADLANAGGIRFYVLGPPRDKAFLDRTEADGENFEKREQKSTVDFAFLSATGAIPLESIDSKLPFKKRHEASDADEIRKVYGQEGNWRKIDHDWLFSAGSLAMRYERSINNTSLALAIQFEDSERVLLFPGDAELGNWESWHKKLEWQVKINGQFEQKGIDYLLSKTVFYKVGHHLSQNGTAKGKGIELMTSTDLTAMATLDFKKINSGWLNTMPNDLLAAELIRKTKGKLFFAGDREKIMSNIKTDRVNVRAAHASTLEEMNRKFDGKSFIDHIVEG